MNTVQRASVARVIVSGPYRWLWLGELVSGTAVVALSSALALEVSKQTHNAALVALLVALVAVPVLLVSGWVAPATRRVGLHRSLWGTQLLMAAATAAVAVLFGAEVGGLLPGFALVTVIGIANAVHVPALFSTLGWFVGERNVPQGVSSFSVRTVLTWILGPLVVARVGGGHHGADLAWVASLTMAAAAVPTIALRRTFRRHEDALREREMLEPGCVQRALDEGLADYELRNVCMLSQAAAPLDRRLRALLTEPEIRHLMLSYGVLYTLLGAFSVLLLPWATNDLGLSAAVAGSLMSIRAAAAVPGPFVAGRATRRFGMSRVLVTASVVTAGAALLAAVQHRWNLFALVAVVVYGAVFYTLTTGTYTTLATVTIGHERRTEGAALFAFVRGAVSVLFVAIGLAARATGIGTMLVICAIGSVATVVVSSVVARSRWTALMARFRAQQAAAAAMV